MNLMRYINLYKEYFKQNIKIMLEYKNDFVIGVFSSLLTQICGIFFIWVLFDNVKVIRGWSFYEIAFIYGLLTMAKSFDMFFFDNLLGLGWDYIREGKFDIFMLRPISPLFQLISSHIQQDGLGILVTGIIILVKSSMELHLHFNFVQIMLLIVFIISGSAIISAINLIAATSAFWTTNSHILIESVSSISQFALYPIMIYPKIIGFILTCILPYAFASFYPANYFLHKGYASFAFYSPIIAIILWVIALKVWGFGLKNYSSTGS